MHLRQRDAGDRTRARWAFRRAGFVRVARLSDRCRAVAPRTVLRNGERQELDAQRGRAGYDGGHDGHARSGEALPGPSGTVSSPVVSCTATTVTLGPEALPGPRAA